MKFTRFVRTIIFVILTAVFVFTTASAQAPVTAENPPPVLPEGVTPQFLFPYPEYPVSDYVYSKTPTFVFSRHPTAIKYRIEVFDYHSGEIVYAYKASGEVHGDSVWIKPPYPLKIYNITGLVGWYRWRVSAKTTGGWETPSSQVDFRVATAGFTSLFDSDYKRWRTYVGAWSVISPGYLKNQGSQNIYDSIAYKHLITNNFDLTVRMKIKDRDTGHYAGVIVAGDPTTISPGESAWSWGYYVLYRDDGKAAVYARDGAGNWVTIFPWTLNPMIKPGDWNKIEVILGENRTKLHVLFNDSLWTTVTIAGGLADGYIGITNYRAGVEKESVWVDWVKMTVFYDV